MSFKKSMHNFLWGGEEVGLGDCLDYTSQSILYILLVWFLTFDRLGVPIGFVLVPWLAVCYFIWKAYFKYNGKDPLAFLKKKEKH